MNITKEDIENRIKTLEEQDPDKIPDNSYVYQNVVEIKDIIKNNEKNNVEINLDDLKIKYKKLFDNYPTIFEKICNGSLELDRLKFMLNMVSQIKSNKISQHEASIKIGTELVENIVKPSIK